jgi:DNA-binding XRE family transcriptional regulator
VITPERRLAKEWKEFREAHWFTQTFLAGMLDISRRTVVAIERAVSTPPTLIRQRFAALKRVHKQMHEPEAAA